MNENKHRRDFAMVPQCFRGETEKVLKIAFAAAEQQFTMKVTPASTKKAAKELLEAYVGVSIHDVRFTQRFSPA